MDRTTQTILMLVGGALGLVPSVALGAFWFSWRGDTACRYLEPSCELESVFGLGYMLGLQLVALPVTVAALVFLANARDLAKPPNPSRDIHSEAG